MFDQNLIKEAKEEISAAKSIAILLPPDPTTDLVAAGLGLYLSLSNSGKQVQIGSSSQIKVENADLFGVDRIKNSIGNQNLAISFDFKEENLKKVDYDVDENGKFMLLIQPQPGCEPPDTSSINYSYSGASADLVFILGVSSLEELGKLYADEKAFLDKAKIVSLNQTNKPSNISSLALHSQATTCLSEIVGFLLKSWQINPTADAATNLLSVVGASTNQFNSPRVTADTFETIAYLMRHGGHLGNSPLVSSSRFGAFPPRPSEAFGVGGPSPRRSLDEGGLNPFGGTPFGNPFMGGSPMMPPTFEDEKLPLPPSFGAPRPSEAFGVGAPRPPRPQRIPGDWKKPKIFKGGNQVGPR